MHLFYLGDLLLPVAPGKLQIKIKNQNKTLTLLNDGEINLLKTPGLSEVSFTAAIPNRQYPFAQYVNGFQPAVYYLNQIEKLKTSCQMFKFRVLRTNQDAASFGVDDTSMDCSLEEYEITEDAEEGMDFSVSIKLKQYRSYATKVLNFDARTGSAAAETERLVTKEAEKTHTVVFGDTLWEIAKTKLGDGNRWKEIYELNKDTIENAAKANGKDSSSGGGYIYTGCVLQLPG